MIVAALAQANIGITVGFGSGFIQHRMKRIQQQTIQEFLSVSL
jgi:ABC-type dipeptide/oligopeptide/nickel transport system permease subunit